VAEAERGGSGCHNDPVLVAFSLPTIRITGGSSRTGEACACPTKCAVGRRAAPGFFSLGRGSRWQLPSIKTTCGRKLGLRNRVDLEVLCAVLTCLSHCSACRKKPW
jgi:hypothetical protein